MNLNQSFVRQQGQADCGVACLLSILRYYGGNASVEQLREISGTNLDGTSLLGLYQGAEKLGFSVEGFEVESIEKLIAEVQSPTILQVLIDKRLSHYVVFYGLASDKSKFMIGDPAKGIVEMSESELSEIWQSKMLLTLAPSEAFIKVAQDSKQKRNWLWKLIQEDTNLLIISTLLGVVLALMSLSTAIFSQKLIDKILPEQNVNQLILGFVLLSIVLLAKAGLGYLHNFFLIRQSKDFNSRLMDEFFTSLLFLPKSFFDTRKTGELVARMNDSRRIQQVINFLVGNVAIDLLVVIISAVFIFNYSLLIAWLSLSAIPLYALLAFRFNKSVINGQKAVMQAYSHTESHYINTLQGIGTIKAGNHECFFAQLTQQVYQFFQEKMYHLGKLGLRYGFWSEVVSTALSLIVIGLASHSVLAQTLKLGEMVAILSLASSIFPATGRLAVTNIQLQEAQVALERLYEFAKITPEYEHDRDIITVKNFNFSQLKIQNLTYRFAGSKPLLKNIDLQLNKGEIVALTGESGSGKSIFLQILQRLYKIETGAIQVNGEEWEKIDLQTWRSLLGVVPQEVSLFNGTLLYNIALKALDESEGKQMIQFLEQTDFHQFFKGFPQSYLTLLGETGINLSGGQKQLIGLARALYRKPQLLLLDEPTAAMDKQTEKFVIQLLQSLKNQVATLLITHKASQTKTADRVYELENGSLCNLL